ncbi:MAG: hypothetical protein WBF79_13465 [Rhodococcus sp. (in: high G+C Gram-positive bacteria)]
MTADPWAGKFCCQVESLYGDVDLRALSAIGERWVRTCFAGQRKPVVKWMLSVGPSFDSQPMTESLVRRVEFGEVELTDGTFQQDAASDFLSGTTTGGVFDPAEVHVVIGARFVRLVYSHLFGDETVFYPKSRRLLLAMTDKMSWNAPPLSDHRSLNGRRIVGAAAGLAARRPKVALESFRQIARERSRLAEAAASDLRVADPEASYVFGVTIDTVTARKIPSVLLYCSVLQELDMPSTVVHHVVTDLRGYSGLLSGTGGNALSHVPFTADWSVQTPDGCAKALSARIRQAEPAVRAAAARVFGLRSNVVTDTGPTASADGIVRVPLSTTMSYFRLPADQQATDKSGAPGRLLGFQNPDLGGLAFNARDNDGRAQITVSHRGGLVDQQRVLAALVVCADRVGCTVSWTVPADELAERVGDAAVRA